MWLAKDKKAGKYTVHPVSTVSMGDLANAITLYVVYVATANKDLTKDQK